MQEVMNRTAAIVSRLLIFSIFLSASFAIAEDAYSVEELPEEAFVALPEPIAPTPPPIAPQALPVSKRLFGIIPNYKADQFQVDYKPLTMQQKFDIARSDSFDWPNYLLLMGFAAQSQMAAGGFSHNGGISGFGKYYSRALGDQIIGSYVTEAILPAMFHEDPRFFRLGVGSVWFRAYNAAAHLFITRKDDGRTGFYLSEILGNAGVTALTTVYYPDSRSAPEGLERYSMALGNDMIANLLTEFWPDIKRRLPFRGRF